MKTVYSGVTKVDLKSRGCGECQTSCQSACKTSCTVGNQVCLKK
ncbi:MAG TPA: six-cysteine peptide SCIFF [Firmicutes bacterium]|nr:six-cysteine peptide SCIFF [Bacillota bacterium]